MSPRQFEELVAEMLASEGWKVHLTPAQKDGGYDIFAISRKQNKILDSSWLVECKRYNEHRRVGVNIIRELFGVRTLLKSNSNLMLATTSDFTRGVTDIKASEYDLELVDYKRLVNWLKKYRPRTSGGLHIEDNRLMMSRKEAELSMLRYKINSRING